MYDRFFTSLLAQVVLAVWSPQLISNKLKSPIRTRAVDLETSFDSSKNYFWHQHHELESCSRLPLRHPHHLFAPWFLPRRCQCLLWAPYILSLPLHTMLCLPIFCPVYPSRRAHHNPTGHSDHRTHPIRLQLSRWYQISGTGPKFELVLFVPHSACSSVEKFQVFLCSHNTSWSRLKDPIIDYFAQG